MGFQAAFVHILTERYAVTDYQTKLATPDALTPLYRDAHFKARDMEGELYKYLFRDNTIVAPHNFRPSGNVPYEIVFQSRSGYKVIEMIDKPDDPVAGIRTWVQKNPLVKVTVDDFIKERETAGPRVPA